MALNLQKYNALLTKTVEHYNKNDNNETWCQQRDASYSACVFFSKTIILRVVWWPKIAIVKLELEKLVKIRIKVIQNKNKMILLCFKTFCFKNQLTKRKCDQKQNKVSEINKSPWPSIAIDHNHLRSYRNKHGGSHSEWLIDDAKLKEEIENMLLKDWDAKRSPLARLEL